MVVACEIWSNMVENSFFCRTGQNISGLAIIGRNIDVFGHTGFVVVLARFFGASGMLLQSLTSVAPSIGPSHWSKHKVETSARVSLCLTRKLNRAKCKIV